MRFWPTTNSNKEFIFLDTIKKVFTSWSPKISEFISLKLIKKISKWLISENLHVIDAAQCLFEIDNFLSYIKTYKKIVFLLIVPISIYQSANHWNNTIASSFTSLSEFIKDIDLEIFDSFSNDKSIDEWIRNLYQTNDKRNELDMKWKRFSKF